MSLSYRLTDESYVTAYGVRVFRIQALFDLPLHGVRKGERGGWVSSAHTSKGKPRLSGQAWLADEAVLVDDARITGSAKVSGFAYIQGSARIRGNARVYGQACVSDKATVGGHARVYGFAAITGQARVVGHAQVFERAVLADHAVVTGMSWVYGQACVSDHATVAGSSEVYAMARVSGFAKVEDVELCGEVHVTEDAHIFNGAQIPQIGVVGGRASISESSHCLSVSPFGPDGATLMVVRQKDCSALFSLGCSWWTSWKQFRNEVKSWEHPKQWRPWLRVIRGYLRAWDAVPRRAVVGMSYELTNLQKTVGLYPIVLFRIRATQDIPEQGVRKGDLGGWVDSAFTATGEPRISGTAWLHDDAELRADAMIQENAWVGGAAIIDDAVIVDGNARIGDHAEITGRCRITGDAVVKDHACLADDVFVCSAALVAGNAWLSGSISLFDNATVKGNAVIRGDAWLAQDAEITEADHVKTFENIGPGRNVTLYRTASGAVRIVEDEWELQSWSISAFEKQLQQRQWVDQVWLTEYRNVIRIAKLLVHRWKDH